MIQQIKTELDLHSLLMSAEQLEYWRDGAGVDMSITQSGGLPPESKPFMVAINEIAGLCKLMPVNLMINRLPKRTMVPIHSDPVKGDDGRQHFERWHLPLKTNDLCVWWDEENTFFNMPMGYWYGPVPYWLKHNVSNEGETERTHLIVDLR
jgi:hypothetical protein